MDRGAWWAAVHGVARSCTQLSDFTFNFQFHALEKEMATHSIVLAWRIPGTGEPDRLPSIGSHRVGHDCGDLAVTPIPCLAFSILVSLTLIKLSDQQKFSIETCSHSRYFEWKLGLNIAK